MRGRKFKHWLSRQMPKRIDDPLLILDAVKRGDKAAIDEMISGHIRLAMALVARYNQPFRSDELAAAALYGLVNAVNRIAEGHLTHDNPTGYIVTFIHGEIRRVINGRGVSVRTVQLGCDKRLPKHKSAYDDTNFSDMMDDFVGGHPDTTLDVEEELSKLIKDETDEQIIRLLRLGYDGVEIGRKLGLHKSNVSRRIARIRQSYKELENV